MENKSYVGFAKHTTEITPKFTKDFEKSDFIVNGNECVDYSLVGWSNNRLAIIEHIHKFEISVPVKKDDNPMSRETLSLVQFMYELRNGNGIIHAVGDEDEPENKREVKDDK